MMEPVQEEANEPEGEISAHSLTVSTVHHTVWIKGVVKKKSSYHFIDRVRTHKFLDYKLVDQDGCIVQHTSPLMVAVANGIV